MKKYTKGFTLIELLVVIAIIGILASVVLVSLNSARKKGNDTRVIADVQQMRTWLETQYNGSMYPLLGSNANCASGNVLGGATFANCVTASPGSTSLTPDANANALNSDASTQGGAGLFIGASAGNAAYVIRGRLASDNTKYFCIDSSGGTNATDNNVPNSSNAMRCN